MGYSRHISGAFLAATFFVGCTSETSQFSQGSEGSNRPPVVRSARILPSPLILSGPITTLVEADDPDRNPISFRYQWLVNGKPVPGETGATIEPRLLKRNDVVAVEVTPLDAYTAGKPYQTEGARVGNTPPEVTKLSMEPSEPRVGDRLGAKVEAVDPDQDDIRYTYRWRRNKSVVTEAEQAWLDTTGFARGDIIVVEVIPADQVGLGKPGLSDPVTIANSPPSVTSSPPTKIHDGLYVYDLQAIDRDKDSLKYALETAPPGMAIDQATGHIEWRLTPDIKGTHRVRVSVSDQQGGDPAFQDFEISFDSDKAS